MEALRKKIKTTAGFGAAMATVYTAPELSADIVGLNFTPGAVNWTSTSTLNAVVMNTTGGGIGGFNLWNDSVGKTFAFNSAGMQSWRSASAGEVLKQSTFAGDTGSWSNSTTNSGTVYMGFKSLDGNVGWFSANLGGAQGDVTFGSSEYGNDGESVTVGVAVPEPSAFGLSLLALGAVGLRRRRASNK
ncbi:PEP-CTERM sorting domain-containing protein [Verrucomicrobiales bacterium]|nr:PEP-CTERM sorting domain-containing protein [Verrucomicrobiales bacterium]